MERGLAGTVPRSRGRSTCSSSSVRAVAERAPATSTRPCAIAERVADVAGAATRRHRRLRGQPRPRPLPARRRRRRDYLDDLLEVHDRGARPRRHAGRRHGGRQRLPRPRRRGVRARDRGGCRGRPPHPMDPPLGRLAAARRRLLPRHLTARPRARLPAMRGYARVVSHPEPGLALLDGGKRDFPYDEGLPVPFGVVERARGARASRSRRHPSPPSTTSTPTCDRMAALPVAIGDVVSLGLSHPCTAFDKWRCHPGRRARRRRPGRRPRAHVLLGAPVSRPHPRRDRRRCRRRRPEASDVLVEGDRIARIAPPRPIDGSPAPSSTAAGDCSCRASSTRTRTPTGCCSTPTCSSRCCARA